ncbi:hypothetical protein MSG28_004792 [Choristoneura fumiferana]|uniref:Uncharacterized protein n=2 Tax=Choristoneura fumiferana TaxID=7141 RepID=A0ACC0K7H2_CHOFU|nr:hypothetical protein MSG28_004792 [Choristoneura fumiferana]KAI8432394.1 hypothetical protein MSG28_004792 [Choristoneura fumiferana]
MLLKINTMFRLIVFLAFAVKINNAAVAILPHVETPPEFGDQKGCYVPVLKRVLEYNRPYSPTDSCVQYTCKVTNETYLYT